MTQEASYKIDPAKIMVLVRLAGAQHKSEFAVVQDNLEIELAEARNSSEIAGAVNRSEFGLAGNRSELASAKNRSVKRKFMLAAGPRWLAAKSAGEPS